MVEKLLSVLFISDNELLIFSFNEKMSRSSSKLFLNFFFSFLTIVSFTKIFSLLWDLLNVKIIVRQMTKKIDKKKNCNF